MSFLINNRRDEVRANDVKTFPIFRMTVNLTGNLNISNGQVCVHGQCQVVMRQFSSKVESYKIFWKRKKKKKRDLELFVVAAFERWRASSWIKKPQRRRSFFYLIKANWRKQVRQPNRIEKKRFWRPCHAQLVVKTRDIDKPDTLFLLVICLLLLLLVFPSDLSMRWDFGEKKQKNKQTKKQLRSTTVITITISKGISFFFFGWWACWCRHSQHKA